MSNNRGGEPAIITIKIINHQSLKSILLIEKAPIPFPKEAEIFSKNTTNTEASQAMIEEDIIQLNPTYNFLRLEECPKNPGLGVANNLKKSIQAPRGVSVGLKNVETSSTSTTLIVDKIGKLEKLIIVGKITLVDDDDKPLKKIDYPSDHDNVDEVELVDNEMALSMASISIGFGTKSLLEKWRDSYENDDYDEDPYDDDMYERQCILDKFKIFAIIWISESEVVGRNNFLFLL
ncbi:hypothetical protein Tco_0561274 [Tanacetum coccineum]